MVTMGKIVGGGMPIGVIGGKTSIMKQANLQEDGNVWIGGGTFSGNPIVVTSAKLSIVSVTAMNTMEYFD